ncbi:signal-regulatory protein beta-2-like [Archocentrus centrarchus]|uniref:signal-regulatory protein beta-2-like n=1 Tax=Archocentrus centrarchus TaxID=63155 RepID=UPI0011E9FBEC|nr:signal-regulatory protein beta-2-like [Archocentrus centrarchus]
MIVLWVTLLVIHRGYTLIPVTTVQLGEQATVPCVLPKTEYNRRVDWYKQSAGDTLQRIWTLKDSAAPEFAPEFPGSRWKVNYDKNFSNLTILRTNQEDEGIYHCGFTEWLQHTKWTGTYLLVKGNTQRSSNYSVVQEKTDHPGESVTLQCSVINDSNNKSCPGGLRVLWIREGSQTSHPGIIYTDGNKHHECEKRSETQQSCSYRISSPDAGTYYCAVATCGEIIFGNGTKLHIEKKVGFEFTALVITTTCLVISMILNIIFICYRTPRAACGQFKKNSSSQARQNDLKQTVDDSTEGGHDLNYAALHFSGRKATRGKKKIELEQEKESVYSQVRM